MKLFCQLLKEIPNFFFEIDQNIIERFFIMETFAIYLENEPQKNIPFNNRKAALVLLTNFMNISKDTTEKKSFYIKEVIEK